jgi:RNA polymerase sigma factor (sigma-70 family)
MVPPPDDAALVAAARRGDRRAFADLVERHHAAVLAGCRSMLREREAAADAAQEAVVQALLSLERLRDEARFGAWLTGIALNVCRRALRERAWEAPDALADLPAEAPGPGELAERAVIAQRVRAAIAALPPGQRRAVFLFYLAGLTPAEVSDHLATPVGAVKTRLHKARANLARRLVDLDPEPEESPVSEQTAAVPMEVMDVRRTPPSGESGPRHVVVLEELGGGRRLPIWIGAPEATAMTIALEDVELPRPGPYHFAGALLQAAGASLREVRISRLTEATFYAVAVLADGSEVDARPSDALTLSLLAGAPILVEEAVLEQTARRADLHAEELAAMETPEADAAALAQETRERLEEQRRELERYAARAREGS